MQEKNELYNKIYRIVFFLFWNLFVYWTQRRGRLVQKKLKKTLTYRKLIKVRIG